MQPNSRAPSLAAHRRGRRAVISAILAALLGVLLIAVPRLGPDLAPDIPLPSTDASSTILLAVGDIGNCSGSHDEAVAKLAQSLPGTIALLGDIAYENGSASDYDRCFDPSWGPLLPRIRPAPGNHEYQTADASGYYAEFGADLVLQGHDHDYERFAPIDGMRSFVVGTGGRSLYELLRSPDPGSELRNNHSYGLLMLTLRATDYSWQFVPASGSTLTDAGADACR